MVGMFNGMFGKIADGMCRMSMRGEIAVKTSTGYKSYNVKTNRLTNCSDFVFNIGEEFFFVIPTNKVEIGDIILVSGKPKCVISSDTKTITVINYEDSTIENVLPERHIFMGNTYFYGKIVSMFGNGFKKGKSGMNKIMSYMMMSEIMKNHDSNNTNFMLPFMMMEGMSDLFDGMFDVDLDEDDISECETEEGDIE